jgi:hypothetical protein
LSHSLSKGEGTFLFNRCATEKGGRGIPKARTSGNSNVIISNSSTANAVSSISSERGKDIYVKRDEVIVTNNQAIEKIGLPFRGK